MNQSAAFNVGYSVGTVLAFITFYGGILALGIYFAKRLARKRDDGVPVHWPIGLAVAVDVLLLLGQCSGSTATQAETSAVNTRPDGIVVRQQIIGNAGSFISEFSKGAVDNYNAGVRDSIISGLRKRNAQVNPNEISVSTEVISLSTHKILQTIAFAAGYLFMYQFSGVSGPNTVLVICASSTATAFALKGTECEEQILKTFGS